MLISSPVEGSFDDFATFGAAKKKAKKPAKKPAVTASAKAAAKAAAKRLQAALVLLGRTVGDNALSEIKIDGAPGQKTADATNRALTKHIGAGQALPQYRTGKLPLIYVKDNAATLAAIIEREVTRRGGTLVSPDIVAAGTAKYKTDAKKAAALAKKAAAAKTAAAKLAAKRAAAATSARAKAKTASEARAAAVKARLLAKQARAAANATDNPELKAKYNAQAAAAENAAVQDDTTAASLTTEARQDALTATTAATQQVAQEASAEAASIDARRQAAASVPTAPPPPSADGDVIGPTATALVRAATPTPIPEDIVPSATASIPDSGGGGGEESTFTKYKWPIIAAGVVGLAGVAFLVFKKPSTSNKPTHVRNR